jgi:hypothetical protein
MKILFRRFFRNKSFRFSVSSFAAMCYGRLAVLKIVDKILFMDATQLLKQLDAAIKQLDSLREVIAQSQLPIPPSIAEEAAKGICHRCKKPIDDKKAIRGCHSACNQEMNRMKNRNEITDAQLIQLGWIGPHGPPGRKRKTSIQDIRDAQERATEQADAASPLVPKKRKKLDGSKS